MLKRRAIASIAIAATIVLGTASSAFAGGNYDYGESRTVLSNGDLYTKIWTNSNEQPNGSPYWTGEDIYVKTGGGAISLEFGFNYHGNSYGSDWQSESAGQTNYQEWGDLGFDDCDDIVGWMAVSGENTYYNAPVTAC